jgi:aminoacrylate hydrolase
MPRIAIGDCQLFYERQGAGFPVILISGLSGFGSFWRDQIPVFAKRYEVITHDHRGIGQSDHCRISYTVDRMAADVVELMDALGVERAHVVGHSTGGAIAQILAIDHPRRLASVVIAASWTRSDAYFRRLFGLRKDILERQGTAAYVQSGTLFLYPILAFDRTSELHRIRTPTLVVGCEDDLMTPPYFSEELARLIPGSEVKMFPRGGHSFTQVAARDFNNAVLPFLAAHSPQG